MKDIYRFIYIIFQYNATIAFIIRCCKITCMEKY